MGVFERIYERILQQGIATPSQIHIPSSDIQDEQLALVHTREYVDAFNNGKLDDARLRRIGFGAVTSTRSLIERTRSEVAGTLLTARLALEHGLAVNTAGGRPDDTCSVHAIGMRVRGELHINKTCAC